jgi:hypothetical protein
MQNFISTFSSSFQFVNEPLSWEEGFPHRYDCHDPPHAVREGLHDDKSPPRRLSGVARSAPWRATSAQAGFPGDAIRRRRSPWVVESDPWCNNRGKDCLRKYQSGEDRHPAQEICAQRALGAAEIALGCKVRPRREQNWRRLLVPEKLRSGCLQLERGLVVHAIWYIVANDHTTTETPLMETPTKTLDQLSKVVVGFLYGSRAKGYVSDFPPLGESFTLLPQEDPLQGAGMKVAMKDLKAVFFVWEFPGNPEHHKVLRPYAPIGTRRIEVTFRDGEKIVGGAAGYDSQQIGFFLFPGHAMDNNIRIFVITRNTRQVKLL